jgi:hypothetical protein
MTRLAREPRLSKYEATTAEGLCARTAGAVPFLLPLFSHLSHLSHRAHRAIAIEDIDNLMQAAVMVVSFPGTR